jgi:hypothetical protein
MPIELDDALRELDRCQFVLQRIFDGDHRALENAANVAELARILLRRAGWVPCAEEEEEI